MTTQIKNETEYNALMEIIEKLMNKGENKLSLTEKKKLKNLALMAEKFEETAYKLPTPTTIQGWIEMRMFENKLKQKDLAILLDVPASRISEFINAKKSKPLSMVLAKKLYKKLNIPAEVLLEL